MMELRRTARVERKTTETHIVLEFCLDGEGQLRGSTQIGFFDHMLSAWTRHGLMDIALECSGDLHVDAHHTVEDTGICLGRALAEAMGDKAGIERFGHALVPMDEALARAVVDCSGRGSLTFRADFREGWVGDFPVSLVREFFLAVAHNAGLTLHLDLLRGENDHHSIEALFKAGARALNMATQMTGPGAAVPSTKGTL